MRLMDSPEDETETISQNSPGRAGVSSLLKIGVTVLGLVLVISRLDLRAFAATVLAADWRWLAVGALLIAASLVLRSYRWHLVLRGLDLQLPFRRLVELYLVGSFFNAFLPSGIGGDVVRAAEAAQDVDAGSAVGTVLIDRLTGLMALFAMALLVLPWRPPDFPSQTLTLIVLLCVAGLVGGLLLANGRLAVWLTERLPASLRSFGDDWLLRTATAIRDCSRSAIVSALLVSVLFNLIQIGWWAATGRALGLSLPLSYYMLVVPILSLAVLVPSIGGLGVRETLAPFLFAGGGLSPEQAVALTLLVFALERVASLLGAPVYILATLRDARGRAS